MSGRAQSGDAFLTPERKAKIDQVVAGRTRSLTVVIEALCDPQNVNAVLRTCESFGIQDVHVIVGPMKAYDRNKKISQNADKWLDVRRWPSAAACLAALKEAGYRILATHIGEGALPLAALDFSGKVALLFGNEHDGVSKEALALADQAFVIPMRGFSQSLNVSVAAAVALARAVEAREKAGGHGDLPAEAAEALRQRFYKLAVKSRRKIWPK